MRPLPPSLRLDQQTAVRFYFAAHACFPIRMERPLALGTPGYKNGKYRDEK
jgi:hypothetical protein